MKAFKEILKKYWGYEHFRPLQEEIINSVFNGQDTLGLLPTGGGKSITFQIPTLAKEGMCLVVTPLIALMQDQVNNLRQKGIKAEAIYSGMTPREIELVFNRASAGELKFLYLSPERLKTTLFRHQSEGLNVNLIAIDEAHCISQWGYDFRPVYLEIKDIRPLFPDVPFLALTASATSDTVIDIQKQLEFENGIVYKKSFFRNNLIYISRKVEDKPHYLLQIAQSINGTGIVYVRNRRRTYEIAKFLYEHKISADYYHAGLTQDVRKQKQQAWQNNQTRVIVSTNAFGMGIDKPDVRFVIHMDLPDSIETYYQEAGRAGRDEQIAYAGIIYNQEDIIKLKESLEVSYPPVDYIRSVYAALGNYFQIPIEAGFEEEFKFNMSEFIDRYHFKVMETYNAIKILEREGWIQLTDPIDKPSKIHFILDPSDLYRFYIKNPDFEVFIRDLLRTYQGLFTSYVNINEYTIARRMNIQASVVIKYLNILHEHQILNYIPKNTSAYIFYLQERTDEKYLHISKSIYQDRKQTAEKKINAVLQFVESQNTCRSRVILEYFDEKNAQDCNICDVCVERKKQTKRIETLREETLKTLQNQPKNMESLLITLKTNKKLLQQSINLLLEEKKIHFNEEQKFELF